MINKDTMYNVKNRSSSVVVYRIPESNLRREFAPGETKRVPFGELEKLTYQEGGRELLENFLQILEEEVTSNLNVNREIEYNMNEQQIAALLQTGSLDAFLDALDFAPIGVIDLIKTMAVQLPLTDMAKRKALKEKTGFDVDKALVHIEEEKNEEKAPAAPASNGRRVQPAAAQTTGRRVQPAETPVAPAQEKPKYVITKKGEEHVE
jgi:hypothetical protein